MTTREARMLKEIRPYEVDRLYKYRSMNDRGVEEIFAEARGKIYLPSPHAFNDPFESEVRLVAGRSKQEQAKYFEEIRKKHTPSAPRFSPTRSVQVLKGTRNSFLAKVGVCCLSERNHDLLMWAHYSDAHQGFCIEFDSSAEDTLFWTAFKVTYTNEYPEVDISRLTEPEEFRKLLLTKASCWEYEEERRIVQMPNDGPGTYPFPASLVTGVIFGARMEDRNRKQVKGWLSKRKSPVRIYQAELDDKQYKVNIIDQGLYPTVK